jgi:hypothetical protein
MPQGHLSSRNCTAGDQHHLWNNNGTWWVHYTLHFGDRKRRIRRSLKTRLLEEAIRGRDDLFARLAREGEWVRERGDESRQMLLVTSSHDRRMRTAMRMTQRFSGSCDIAADVL